MIQLLFIIFIIFKIFNSIKNKELHMCKNHIHIINHDKNLKLNNNMYDKCKLYSHKNIKYYRKDI
jgi:hypothetical protein